MISDSDCSYAREIAGTCGKREGKNGDMLGGTELACSIETPARGRKIMQSDMYRRMETEGHFNRACYEIDKWYQCWLGTKNKCFTYYWLLILLDLINVYMIYGNKGQNGILVPS